MKSEVPETSNVFGRLTSPATLESLARSLRADLNLDVQQVFAKRSSFDGAETLRIETTLCDLETTPLSDGEWLLNGYVAGTPDQIFATLLPIVQASCTAGAALLFEIYDSQRELIGKCPAEMDSGDSAGSTAISRNTECPRCGGDYATFEVGGTYDSRCRSCDFHDAGTVSYALPAEEFAQARLLVRCSSPIPTANELNALRRIFPELAVESLQVLRDRLIATPTMSLGPFNRRVAAALVAEAEAAGFVVATETL